MLKRQDLAGALKAKGFEEDASRDHDFYFLLLDGRKQATFTKLSRGTNHRDLGDPLVSKIARQLHLNKLELQSFVQCSISAADYVRLRAERIK